MFLGYSNLYCKIISFGVNLIIVEEQDKAQIYMISKNNTNQWHSGNVDEELCNLGPGLIP